MIEAYAGQLHSADDLIATVEQYGFLPFFRNEIPGFSVEELCPPELWFADDADGPWEWKGPAARSGKCLYGKLFNKKAGFVSREWIPDFANFRRDGYDFDARWDDGLASYKDKELYDEFLKLMQDAGYEIKTGKYISFRAEGQERFTRAKTIGDNYTEDRIKERIQGRNARRRQIQNGRKNISLISDIQNRIKQIDSKGFEHSMKIKILKEAARTLNYLTENELLQYADLEKKVEDIHSSYERTGADLKIVESQLRKVQPLIKNISTYQKLKPIYDAYSKAKNKQSFRAAHEAELVVFEAAKSTLLAMQDDEKLPSLKSLQAEQQRLLEEQQRLYDERARLKKEAKVIDTMKANVDDFLSPILSQEHGKEKSTERE